MMGLLSKTFRGAANAIALVLFAAGPAMAEGPVLDRFFPAGIQRGGHVQVQAFGRFGAWPSLKAWADRPGLSIAALAEPGKLLVRAAADAEPGVYWVRLYDATGASDLRPLVVGTLPELSDHEPNDTWRVAQRIEQAACTINGRLASPGDCDVFAMHVPAGQTLVAWVEAERPLGSPMDGVLQILDSSGTVLAQNHDAIGLDPCVAVATVDDPPIVGAASRAAPDRGLDVNSRKRPARLAGPTDDGLYFVRLFAFPAKPTSDIRLAGGEDYIYRLTITSQAAISYAFPLSIGRSGRQAVQLRGWNLSPEQAAFTLDPPAGRDVLTLFRPDGAGQATVRIEDVATQIEQEPNPPQHANAIHLPGCICGTIGRPGDADTYSFFAQDGQTVCFRLESAELGFPLDGALVLDDADGNRMAAADDTEGRRDTELMYTVALGGQFRLTVRDLYGHGGWRYAYRLRASLAEPDFVLKVGSGLWSTTAGGQLDLPVIIERRNGFQSPIRLTLAGLPPTASCPAVESQPGEFSASNATFKVSAGAQPFSGPIRILGTAVGERPFTRHAQAEIEGFNSGTKTDQLWLTITGKEPAAAPTR
jgi:hypothetical protein